MSSLNTRTILLTGARSFVALDLARVFHHAGYRVIAADSLKSAPCRFSRCVETYYQTASPAFHPQDFISDLQTIIQNEGVECLIPTCEEIFYIGHAKNTLDTSVFAEEFGVLEELHNKWKFYQLLCQIGLPTPETHLWNPQINREGKWVRKPVYSRFAASLTLSDETTEVGPSSPENPLIEQDYIEGEKICSYSICQKGQVVAHTVYRALHTMGIGSAICVETIEDEEVDAFVQTLVSHLNFTGQIAFDFIRSDTLYCIECNPRGTSGIHLFGRTPALATCFFNKLESPLTPTPSQIFHDPLFMLWFGFKQKEGFTKQFWSHFFQGKNPMWSKGDNRVMAFLPLILLEAFKLTVLKGKTFHQAMSEDLEYNGGLL